MNPNPDHSAVRRPGVPGKDNQSQKGCKYIIADFYKIASKNSHPLSGGWYCGSSPQGRKTFYTQKKRALICCKYYNNNATLVNRCILTRIVCIHLLQLVYKIGLFVYITFCVRNLSSCDVLITENITFMVHRWATKQFVYHRITETRQKNQPTVLGWCQRLPPSTSI